MLSSMHSGRRLGVRLLPLFLACWGAATPPAQAQDEAETETEAAIAYETRIEGVPEKDLRQLLKQSSQLVALADRPPSTLAGLRRRARDDMARLRTALRSEGFYKATLDFAIREDAEPLEVVVTVDTGPVYLLEEARVVYQPEPGGESAAELPRTAEDLGLEIGMRARAPEVLAAQRRLETALGNRGYARAEVQDRKAVVNHQRTTLSVTWTVDPGRHYVFGDWRLEGLTSVEADYLRGLRTWEPGTPFDQREVAATRQAVLETGLFETVRVERGEPTDGRLPVVFRFTERAHRSIGFAVRFSTAEGPSGTAFWEHRNLLGADEDLRLALDAGVLEQKLSARASKPRFLRPDQSLNADAELARRDTDAFEEEAVQGTLELERDLWNEWRVALGGSLEFTQTRDNEGERTFSLVGVPGRLSRDTRDDLLNPTEGTLVEARTTPYFVTVDRTEAFLRNSLIGRGYLKLDEAGRLVLAGRGKLGSILGVETENIPASKRFFAGGGGSIRGFDFQEVGPLDDDNDPLGGRSVLEMSVELRWQVTDSIGIVPFLDAGNVYDDPLPFMSENDDAELRYAAGLGLRYFTPIGPLRIDVARGLNRRDLDDAFELYISLGQAF